MQLTVWLVLYLSAQACGWTSRNTSTRGGGLRLGGAERERGTGVKIGGNERGRLPGTGKVGVGVVEGVKPSRTGAVGRPTEAPITSTARVPEKTTYVTNVNYGGSEAGKEVLKMRLVLPYRLFGGIREYAKGVKDALSYINKKKFNMFNTRSIDPDYSTLKVTPSPTTCAATRDGIAGGVRRRTGLQIMNIGNHTWRRRSGATTQIVPATGGPTVATKSDVIQYVRHGPNLTLAILLPHTNFGVREYYKTINDAVKSLHKGRPQRFSFLQKYNFGTEHAKMKLMTLTPSPTAILNSLCQEFLTVNVSAILYLMNYESYGRSTASAQYFLQLAGYLGIPVIAWNADNSGLERKFDEAIMPTASAFVILTNLKNLMDDASEDGRASVSSLQLQLAPSLEHQIAAMLSILERYKWHSFSIVTSQIAGHADFIQAVRERISEMQDRFKFHLLNTVLVTGKDSLRELVSSESRVMLLYSTRDEASHILSAAREYKITGENYVWVVTQSVIGDLNPPPQFPVGMLGVHFDTSSQALVNEVYTAVKVYAYGVEDFVNDPRNANLSLNTQLACERVGESRWNTGDRFYKYLRNVSFEEPGRQKIEFTADGVLKSAELKIMNLRPLEANKQLQWEEIGAWKSWQTEGLDIKDIVWPGNSHTPPQGVPEKFHLQVTFLEEAPYINLAPPDPVSGKCNVDRGVLCKVSKGADSSDSDGYKNKTLNQCCSGFCIDLLERFAEELGFTYELVRVEDGKWGTIENGEWNGLIGELVNRKTDMVMTSLMINSDREAAIDFTVPFLESGVAIVVAKRTGIISPTAFLEPFDSASWMLVGLVAIQVSAVHIFIFEWLSPSGFNMKKSVTPNARFSLLRSYWLVWAVLFQASVHVDAPRGFTARFMTNVWAMFAVVFLAIYTANLAAFMITREEYHEFSGLDDYRLASPHSVKPALRFGTVPWTHSEATIKKYFVPMHRYMKQYNKSVVADGVDSVLSGELDAFIYDGTVLDYLASQDEDCRLVTMGSWYAMTGYGIGFPRHSKYLQVFNKRLLDYRENGHLERIRRYWMTGTCHPGKQEHKSSDPLALEQFLSAFLLLMSGVLLAALLLLFEHLYFKYVRRHLAKTDQGGCCALVSLSMGKSLTFRGAVFEAQDMMKHHRCQDPICDTHLLKARHELDLARIKIRQLYKEMEAHGIRPSRRFLSSADIDKPKSLTRNWVSAGDYGCCFSEPATMYRQDGGPATEIAEMETVL